MSHAVFAHYLHLTAGYVSQLERGIKHPTGPALVLLTVIRQGDRSNRLIGTRLARSQRAALIGNGRL